MAKKLHRGHIEVRGENSRRIIVTLGKLSNGRPHIYRETITALTPSEADRLAQQRLVEILHQYDQGRKVGTGRMLYGDFLDYWLEAYVGVELDVRTQTEYEAHVKNRVKPGLGHYSLNDLNPMIIASYYAAIQRDGKRLDGKPGKISAATVQRLHAVVRGSLRKAVEWGILTYNPADNVSLPKPEKPKKHAWSEDDLARFLAFISGHPYEVFILTLAYTGMRISEASALRWSQIHWAEGYILVDRALKKTGRQWADGKTKNKKTREIPLDYGLAEVLERHRLEQIRERQDLGPDWNPQGLVFPNRNGNPIDKSNFRNRVWVPLQEQFNAEIVRTGEPPLPYLNPHGLRHTLGTILARSGEIKTGADILGHHSTAFFMDQYVHPDLDDRRRALGRFADRLRGSSQNLPKRRSWQ